jgi:outer membrane protein TolC
MRSAFLFSVKLLVFLLMIILLFSTQLSSAQEIPASLTLGQAVARALQANPQMAAIRAQALGAEFGKRSARAAFGPSLSANYGMIYDDKPIVGRDKDTWTLNINLSQPLFTGWRLLSTYQRAALIQEQLETRITATELQLILTVQEHFLNLLKAREQVRSAQDSVVRLQSHLQRAQAFYDVGLQPRVDLLSAEVELAQAEQELLMFQNTVLTQIARLNTLLNLDLEEQVDYVGELAYLPYEPNLQDCLDRAFANRPDIILSKKAEEIAEKELKITASAFYPQIRADLDYYRRGNDPGVSGDGTRPDPWWTASVVMQWQVFEWGKTRYAYEQAKQNLRALRQETAKLRLEVSYEVKSLHLKLQEASARISVARKALEEAREAFRNAQARYQAQVGTNIQVLDEQARLTRAEAGLTDALADYQFAMARLFAAMGQQNPDLTIP